MNQYSTLKSTLPLIEQVAERDLLPFCLIGIKMDDSDGIIDCLFANHSDDLNYLMYEVCKNFVTDYEKNNPEQFLIPQSGEKTE